MQDPDSESHTVISIHAPTRGATYDCSFGVEQASISIHAPTRGATLKHKEHMFFIYNFNPRSYKRSDHIFI